MRAFQLNHSFGVSVVLHGLLVVLMILLSRIQGPVTTPRTLTWIEVDPIPQSKDSSKASRQIVQTEKAKESSIPAPDAFLGERTQTVDQQRVSQKKEGQAPQASAARQARVKKSASNSRGELAQFGVALPAPGMNPRQQIQETDAERGSLSAQARGEYVKGFKEGEATLLNTREYVFYGYFQRIREKLDRAWERSLRSKLDQYFHRGRQLASETDYTTQLLVTLDSDGQVVRVQTLGASGARDLDDAAVKAFNEAGPFPNPPKGLVESGKIQVRWDFVLRT